jgi:hypothetical protein
MKIVSGWNTGSERSANKFGNNADADLELAAAGLSPLAIGVLPCVRR